MGGGYHPPVEEYLETILGLEEAGIRPMRARIVERLGGKVMILSLVPGKSTTEMVKKIAKL